MQTFIAFTVIEGAGEYRQVSFDIAALIETYGEETTVASVPELFPILGWEVDEMSITDIEDMYPPDSDEALTTLEDLAEEIADMEPGVGVAATIGNEDEAFHLIPINLG